MLSPWLALHSGAAKRLMYFALRVPRLVYAESEHANALLERYHADALLLQNGSYLVDKSIFGHNEKVIGLFAKRDIGGILRETETDPSVSRALARLIRVVTHENIEKLMRVIAATDSNRYFAMKSYILSQKKIIDAYSGHLSAASRKRALTDDLLFNDITASAFEIILLRRAGVIDEDELSRADAALAKEADRKSVV